MLILVIHTIIKLAYINFSLNKIIKKEENNELNIYIYVYFLEKKKP